ncbi:EF-hand [Serendipita vermifera]|nr:EF-hand [Serendipita vermifera]
MAYNYGSYGPPSGPPPGSGYGNRGYGGAPGGFNAGGPPPGADPKAWELFKAVDADGSNAITATELQQALVNGNWTPFDLDTVKLLMGMFDPDRNGTIEFKNFQDLLKYITDWQNVFTHFDKDRSGTIQGHELSTALSQFGYNLSPQLLHLLERKYGIDTAPHPSHGGYGFSAPPQGGGITFDRFIRCCVVVRQLTEAFQKCDPQRTGWIQINYENFMHLVLSAT